MFINNFDPVAFQVFSIEIRWYSLAYIFGIIIGWWFGKKIITHISKNNNLNFDVKQYHIHAIYIYIPNMDIWYQIRFSYITTNPN